MTSLLVTKSDGSSEPFDPSKLERSLAHAGASPEMQSRVVTHILGEIQQGMTTEDIYRHAFHILAQEERAPVAARYSVKRAVFALGPSGFPFEQFLAEVMRGHGWHAETGVTLQGKCAEHEVDVLCEKDGRRIGIEAKFHNDPAGKTDIKDALYVKARYEDLANTKNHEMHVDEGWLVTNTRFTRNAENYAMCSGLILLGWEYPRRKGLMVMIQEARVHPLTCLTTLSESEKRRLLERKIVLCKHVQTPHLLTDLGVRPDKIPAIIDEAQQLCGI